MSSDRETVPGLEYHGVPVPLDVFQDDAWNLREGEFWRRGVDDALEKWTPLLTPPAPFPGNDACAVCTHLRWQHPHKVKGISGALCGECPSNDSHAFRPAVAP